MTITEKVQRLIADRPEAKVVGEELRREQALQNAEALADLYHDIRPQTFAVPMERFLGLPAFAKQMHE